MHIYGIQKDGNDNPICKTEKEKVTSLQLIKINGKEKTEIGEWAKKKKRPIYMPSTTDPRQIQRYKQTESEGMEKDNSIQMKKEKLG